MIGTESERAPTVKICKSKDRDWLTIKGGNKIFHSNHILERAEVTIFHEIKDYKTKTDNGQRTL